MISRQPVTSAYQKTPIIPHLCWPLVLNCHLCCPNCATLASAMLSTDPCRSLIFWSLESLVESFEVKRHGLPPRNTPPGWIGSVSSVCNILSYISEIITSSDPQHPPVPTQNLNSIVLYPHYHNMPTHTWTSLKVTAKDRLLLLLPEGSLTPLYVTGYK